MLEFLGLFLGSTEENRLIAVSAIYIRARA
jgi:hypothetical protein